ncbi:ATP-binding protein [Polaromonas sp.]|uniref:sensor histidine kinase n=1 Tax=Polaromonas sp. TaxID=1869339 RepID=UPI00286CCE67|nr:ATP-binding protein [Polaromonas sp.]
MSEFRLAYSKAGAIVSAVLVMFGLGLDYSLYPALFAEFATARVVTTTLTLLVFWMLRDLPLGQKYVQPLTLLWLALPQIMISWMIWRADGVDSIYFVGLHLALYATGIILPIGFLEGVGFGLLTYLLYFLACYLHPQGLENISRFTGVSMFILFSASVSAFCTYFNERGRLNVFSLQYQVAEKNAALEKTNKVLAETNAALAEVKGQLIQREKMAALGTLSAGLLHEVNNPVNYSLMAINMALMEPAAAQNANLKESLTDAREGMQRIQSIVSDLKTFAYQKPGVDGQRVFLLEKAIQSALRLTSFELKGVKVDMALPQDTHVLGDEPAIIGVLINLFSNAALALNSAAREQPQISLRGEHRDGRLWLAVRDNGTGIAPENVGRVLEPFFTTRDVGAGLGLGLSVSYGIIQRHGGLLAVTSEFGAWTEFSLDLAEPQS